MILAWLLAIGDQATAIWPGQQVEPPGREGMRIAQGETLGIGTKRIAPPCRGGMILAWRLLSMSHTYCSALFHCVFSTKERKRAFTPELQGRLWAYMGGIAREN